MVGRLDWSIRETCSATEGGEPPQDRRQSAHRSEEAGSCPWSEGAQGDEGVKSRPQDEYPALVPAVPEAKQAGSIRDRWAWVEPVVWTDRMLTALEEGVKGGVWCQHRPSTLAQSILCCPWAVLSGNRPCRSLSIPIWQGLHRPERRVRETCMHGSEGGRDWDNRSFLPL